MRCRRKMARAGDVLPVSDSNFHYQLPAGLAAGTLVKLVSFDRGYWTVEAEGREYRVFVARIDSGWEYEVNGRWVAKASSAVSLNLLRDEPLRG